MERTASVLSPLLKKLGIEEGTRLVCLQKDWDTILDKTLTMHMSPSKLTEGELLLNVDSPVWIQQLTYLKNELIKKLGAYGVKSVRFRLGKIYKTKENTAGKKKPRELSGEDMELINSLISEITDNEIKKAAKSAIEKSLKSSARNYP